MSVAEIAPGQPLQRTELVVTSCARGAKIDEAPTSLTLGRAHPGDLIVAKVVSVGSYPAVELPDGRERRIWPGDRIVGVAGHRHSTTSIYGSIPHDGLALPAVHDLDLLAVGGVVGNAESWPASMGAPTKLQALGLLRDDTTGTPLCLQQRQANEVPDIPLILIGGTAAEVGKTTLASKVVNYLAEQKGLRVGVCKMAGTGRMRDLRSLMDAGASVGLDFVDGGLPTTYGPDATAVTAVGRWLVHTLAQSTIDIAVGELGGDIIGANVPALLKDPQISRAATQLAVVGSDVLSCVGAAAWMERNNVSYVTKYAVPRRTPAASAERLADQLGDSLVDPDDRSSLAALVDACVQTLPKSSRDR